MDRFLSGWKGLPKDLRDVYKYRFREQIKTDLEHLATIAEKLPESDLETLFNSKKLLPFFKGLFEREDLTKQDRLLILSIDLIRLLEAWGRKLESYQYLMRTKDFTGLQAIRMTWAREL